MSASHRLITQTGIQLAGKIASVVLGVVAIAIITRALGRAGYGEYATVMAYLQLFGIAVDLGLNVLGPQMLGAMGGRRGGDLISPPPAGRGRSRGGGIARASVFSSGGSYNATPSYSPSKVEGENHGAPPLRSPDRLLSNIFTIRLIAAVIVFAIAAAIAFAIPQYSMAVRVGIAAATFSFLAIVLTQILQAPFQVAQRMVWPTIAEVAGRAVLVGGVAIAAWLSPSSRGGVGGGVELLPIVWATVAGNVVMFVLAFVAARRIASIRLSFDWMAWRAILAQSWPIALSIIFNLVYLRADAVILSLFRSAEDVGIYAAPYRLLDVVTQVPHLAMGLALPLLAASWAAGDRVAFQRRTQRMVDGLAFLGLPLVAGSLTLGTPVMTLIAGREFAASGPVLGVLALALVGIFLGQPFGYGVVAVGAQRRMLWGYAAVAVVTLAGYLTFIPLYSYWAAAWLTVASECAIALITWRVVRAATGVRLSPRIPLAALLASTTMAAAVLATPSLPIIPRIALGIIVYVLATLTIPWTRCIITTTLQRR